jgi:ferric enterobactin receptor
VKKIISALALSLVFCSVVLAQAPGAKPGGPPSIGRVYGKILDSVGQPVGQASALVLKSVFDTTTKKKRLTLLKGMDTKANGEFNFEDMPISIPLVLRVSATGYQSRDLPFNIVSSAASAKSGPPGNSSPFGNIPSFEKDMGSIRLNTDVKLLNAVDVTAKTPAMKLELDKKVFNVERNLVSAGGTAVDVMRNVPSVNVDIDGNVSLRGATPTIFVDGRPTTLSLDQIPADAIESVEVMTNPSAKYDASGGGAGILNIVLKKNRKKGYNGSISAGIDSHGAPNALVGFNIRQDKINVSANGMVNFMNGRTTGNTDRFTYLTDTTHLLQQDINRNKGHFMFGQIGLDYFVSNKTTLSGSYIKVHGSFTPTDQSQIQTDSLTDQGTVTNYSYRTADNSRVFDVNGVQLGMKHLFAKEGEQLTADGSYFGVNAHTSALYTTNYFTGQPGTPVYTTTQQQTLATADPAFFTVQTDYTNPLTPKTKLEAGLRASIQRLSNNNNTYTIDKNGETTLDSLGISDYKSTSRVYAAYANLTSGFGKFGYAIGLRLESSSYSGDLLNTGQHFSNTYPLSFFPSIFLSQKFAHDQELQLSATRKVNRPGFFQLIPYTDYSDTLNITRGNPNLVPEFTESFELSYIKTFPHNNTLLISTYYKYTSNLITRFQDSGVNPIGKPILINTYENANDAYTVGAEFTLTYNVTKWWDGSLNLNAYNSHINTENLNQPSQSPLWSLFGKFNSNFKLPANFTLQLTAIYQSKTNLPVNLNSNQFGPPGSNTQSSSQGYIKPFWGMDIAIKKSFLKNNAASITVSVTDIFRTRWSDQFSQSAFFAQEYDRLKDPQLVRFVFAYRFGKMDLNLFKRKNMNAQGMGDAGSSLQ